MRARLTTLLAVALLWTTGTATAGGTLTELMTLHTQGVNHELGRGVERDYLAAANYYRAAAERGYADSQHDLARLFDDGRGVRANVEGSGSAGQRPRRELVLGSLPATPADVGRQARTVSGSRLTPFA